MIKLILPIEPVAQARPRARRFGKGIRLYDPPKTAKFKKQLRVLATEMYHDAPVEGEIYIKVAFYRKIQKSISKRVRKGNKAWIMEGLKKQLKHERKEVDEKIDELVAFLDIQREHQTVSDAQLSLAETQFMLLETYYVLINRRIKDLKRKRG